MPKQPSRRGRRVKFSIQASPRSEVYVAGTFNGWDPKKNRLEYFDDCYSTIIVLSPGRHEYKFVIDDVWCVDPDCTNWTPNGLGSLNSVLVVE